jgi:hypothetical protein
MFTLSFVMAEDPAAAAGAEDGAGAEEEMRLRTDDVPSFSTAASTGLSNAKTEAALARHFVQRSGLHAKKVAPTPTTSVQIIITARIPRRFADAFWVVDSSSILPEPPSHVKNCYG